MDWLVVVSAVAGVLMFGRYVYLWRRSARIHEGKFLKGVRRELVFYTFLAIFFEAFALLHMKDIGGYLAWPHIYGGLAFASIVFAMFFIGNLLVWMGVEARPDGNFLGS